MDMISLSHINKSYGKHSVLRDVSLTVRQGEIYGLVGKNGAGKTTIFKIILGLTEFDKGQLSITKSRSKAELSASRRKIGFFIGKNFFDYQNARENLEYYRRLKGIRDKSEVDRVLRLVELEDAAGSFGRKLRFLFHGNEAAAWHRERTAGQSGNFDSGRTGERT